MEERGRNTKKNGKRERLEHEKIKLKAKECIKIEKEKLQFELKM